MQNRRAPPHDLDQVKYPLCPQTAVRHLRPLTPHRFSSFLSRTVEPDACEKEVPMHLSKFSDYALRVLMIAAARGDDRLTIQETAATFGISQGHLKKVVLKLTRAGYLRGIKGRSGGYLLAKSPEEINLGAVLRMTETDFGVFECFHDGQTCPIVGPCRLPSLAHKAISAFLATFDQVTLADVALPMSAFRFDANSKVLISEKN
jgi:Rrf2 family nitric oxide-sensitive transcriptional repressor